MFDAVCCDRGGSGTGGASVTVGGAGGGATGMGDPTSAGIGAGWTCRTGCEAGGLGRGRATGFGRGLGGGGATVGAALAVSDCSGASISAAVPPPAAPDDPGAWTNSTAIGIGSGSSCGRAHGKGMSRSTTATCARIDAPMARRSNRRAGSRGGNNATDCNSDMDA
jgi:hypothetical protein